MFARLFRVARAIPLARARVSMPTSLALLGGLGFGTSFALNGSSSDAIADVVSELRRDVEPPARPKPQRKPSRMPTAGEKVAFNLVMQNSAVYLLWWMPSLLSSPQAQAFHRFMDDTFTTSYGQMTRGGIRGALTTVTGACSTCSPPR